MQQMRSRTSGFTLIELMIVVVIIGILAAMALPRFIAVSTKSKQTEAKMILKQIHNNQHVYFQEHETYWIPPGGTVASAANPLALSPIIAEIMNSSRYSYVINATPTTFTATATSGILDDDATVDEWNINELSAQSGRLPEWTTFLTSLDVKSVELKVSRP